MKKQQRQCISGIIVISIMYVYIGFIIEKVSNYTNISDDINARLGFTYIFKEGNFLNRVLYPTLAIWNAVAIPRYEFTLRPTVVKHTGKVCTAIIRGTLLIIVTVNTLLLHRIVLDLDTFNVVLLLLNIFVISIGYIALCLRQYRQDDILASKNRERAEEEFDAL